MNFKNFLKLRAAGNRLPDDAYLAYNNIEIYGFSVKPIPGIELDDSSFVKATDINRRAITLRFD
ncbi:hypothetical protein [Alteromonas naphthalenivorans]|uniref:Uncharacterized protein n=1 Tax=Alteromonas naphthalenivorans TaxID=715451 RepID=F5Z5E8_ALTNA|nr:hypothetical protein [Alteromonas naphthalenivorans]AEF04874.1 hypothetical protein ambt_16845 [Alteromonas naphthalenivorans]